MVLSRLNRRSPPPPKHVKSPIRRPRILHFLIALRQGTLRPCRRHHGIIS